MYTFSKINTYYIYILNAYSTYILIKINTYYNFVVKNKWLYINDK